jgi:2-C-methyl-D-erythritol 4-phosphate cytidylyltransferase
VAQRGSPLGLTVWTIVVAAGGGDRFGAPKQFARLGRGTVLDQALGTAQRASAGVVVVLPADATWQPPPGIDAVTGGATRAESVRCGLARVPDDAGVVVVHDAARPLATLMVYAAVIEAVRGGADGAVPGLAVADTLKRVDGAARVVGTVERDGLVAVQTPQAFGAETLRRAHASGADATDDAALVEAIGGTVVVVPGEARNFKITTAADLEIAAALLAAV